MYYEKLRNNLPKEKTCNLNKFKTFGKKIKI